MSYSIARYYPVKVYNKTLIIRGGAQNRQNSQYYNSTICHVANQI